MPYIAQHSGNAPVQPHRFDRPTTVRRELEPLGLPTNYFFRSATMPNGPNELEDLPLNYHGQLPYPNPASSVLIQKKMSRTAAIARTEVELIQERIAGTAPPPPPLRSDRMEFTEFNIPIDAPATTETFERQPTLHNFAAASAMGAWYEPQSTEAHFRTAVSVYYGLHLSDEDINCVIPPFAPEDPQDWQLTELEENHAFPVPSYIFGTNEPTQVHLKAPLLARNGPLVPAAPDMHNQPSPALPIIEHAKYEPPAYNPRPLPKPDHSLVFEHFPQIDGAHEEITSDSDSDDETPNQNFKCHRSPGPHTPPNMLETPTNSPTLSVSPSPSDITEPPTPPPAHMYQQRLMYENQFLFDEEMEPFGPRPSTSTSNWHTPSPPTPQPAPAPQPAPRFDFPL